jgi:hypothetical protein
MQEMVPLDWENQVVRRVGAEYAWNPTVTFRGGYADATSTSVGAQGMMVSVGRRF